MKGSSKVKNKVLMICGLKISLALHLVMFPFNVSAIIAVSGLVSSPQLPLCPWPKCCSEFHARSWLWAALWIQIVYFSNTLPTIWTPTRQVHSASLLVGCKGEIKEISFDIKIPDLFPSWKEEERLTSAFNHRHPALLKTAGLISFQGHKKMIS